MTTNCVSLANEALACLKNLFLLDLLSCMSCITVKKTAHLLKDKKGLNSLVKEKRDFFQVEKKKILSKYPGV